jgi:hypothetical protein
MHCLLLEGVQLEGVLLGQRLSREGRALVAFWEVDLVDASCLIADGLDGDVLEAFSCILVLAVSVVFGEVERLLDVLPLRGQRLSSHRVGPLRGIEDVKGILFHC